MLPNYFILQIVLLNNVVEHFYLILERQSSWQKELMVTYQIWVWLNFMFGK